MDASDLHGESPGFSSQRRLHTRSSDATLDGLIGNPDIFPILREWHYFNHAGVSPAPTPVADALRRFAQESTHAAYLGATWFADLEHLRRDLAQLINASSPDEIALVKNTSEGLGLIAAGIDWHPGDRIITTGAEYPSNVYPWLDAARRSGAELVVVPEATRDDGSVAVPTELILREIAHPATRLVSVSHVQYASGQRMELAAIGAACRARGVLLCVDVIQSLGVMPVDVEAMNIDFLAAGGHKWLMSPFGAGLLYVRRELIDRVRPTILGWASVADPLAWHKIDLTFPGTARRFESGTHPIPSLLGMKAAVGLLTSAGIDRIEQRLILLTDRLAQGLRQAGCQIVSPRAAGEASGALCFTRPGVDLEALAKRLNQIHRIEVAVRGGRMRVAPHFYNTIDQIDGLVRAIELG